MNEYFKKGALRSMSDDEREAILNGNHWNSTLTISTFEYDR